MQQPHTWIWGLIPAAVLWLLAGTFQTGTIEQDLAAKAGQIVASQGIGSPATTVDVQDTSSGRHLRLYPNDPRISVAGRDVTVYGTRFSGDGTDLTKSIDQLNGVRLVRNETTLVQEAKPYRWSLSRDGAQVTLAGNVPSPDLRERLVADAKVAFPGAQVKDAMVYARGASGGVETLTGTAFTILKSLVKGSAEIVDGVLSVEGEASSGEAYRGALAAVKAIPAAALGKMDLHPPTAKPYSFMAEKKPGMLILSGYYPDEKSRKDLLALAKRLFFGVEISDKMQEARGEPTNFSKAAAFALSQLSRLDTGTVSLVDQAYKLTGTALYDKAVEQLTAAVKSALPQGFTGQSEVGVKSVEKELDLPTCQALMTGLLGKNRVLFETGGAKIDADSSGLLDTLVFTAKSCPSARIEVSGHTDSDGDDGMNLDLSKRRAQAVVGYLTASGIADDRIHAAGYGETRPIASNDTEDGKALNRRIEFTIQ